MNRTHIENIIKQEYNVLTTQLNTKASLEELGYSSDVSWFNISCKLIILDCLKKITIFVQEDIFKIMNINYLLFKYPIDKIKAVIPDKKQLEDWTEEDINKDTEYVILPNWEMTTTDSDDKYIEIDNWDDENL